MVRRNIPVFVRALGISLPRFNQAYIKAIKALPCCVCPQVGCIDPSHPRGLAWGCGTGLKAPDETAIPLCRRHHDEYHAGQQTWEARHGTHEHHLQKTWKKLAKATDASGPR